MKLNSEKIRLLLKAMKNSERRLENSAKGVNAAEIELTRELINDLKEEAVKARKKEASSGA